MTADSHEPCFSATISPWKFGAFQAMLFWLAIWPLVEGLPTTGRDAYYSQPPFVFIFYIFGPLLFVLSVGTLPATWRALRGMPAIEIWDDKVVVYSIPRRTVARSNIEGIAPAGRGLAILKVTGEKAVYLPMLCFKKPKNTLLRLEALLGSNR